MISIRGSKPHLHRLLLIGLPAAAISVFMGCPRKSERSGTRKGGSCPVRVEPGLFAVQPRGSLATVFAKNRASMHEYLYNGDDLWPKKADLCARGRNALLDLERGPGTSFDLGLFGAAWKAQVHAVAATLPSDRSMPDPGGTRFTAVWPVITDGMTRWLVSAHELFRQSSRLLAAPHSRTIKALDRLSGLGRALQLPAYLLFRQRACRSPASGSKKKEQRRWICPALSSPLLAMPSRGSPWSDELLGLARDWGSRLVVALVHRLSMAGKGLPASLDGGSSDRTEALVKEILATDDESSGKLTAFITELEKSSRAAGFFYPYRTYNEFRSRHLTACIKPYGCGLSLSQLGAVEEQIVSNLKRRLGPKLGEPGSRLRDLAHARPDLRTEIETLIEIKTASRRIRYITTGSIDPSMPLSESVQKTRLEHTRLTEQMERDRIRLGSIGKAWFEHTGRKALDAMLAQTGDLAAAGSFYFQTEHLNEALSGFTHAALLQRLGRIDKIPPGPWQWDRVLGFYYIYPLSRLTTSVPVEILSLDRRVMSRDRRYAWVRLEIPRVFVLPNRKTSDVASLTNIFFHLKNLLNRCPNLRITSGFYFSAVAWMLHNPHNRELLMPCRVERSHTGYLYKSLDPACLGRLVGKELLIPVEHLSRSAHETS